MPEGTILDDVLLPMQIVRQGSRVVFDSRARAWDSPDLGEGREFSRKVRTLSGNYQLLQLAPWLLSSRKCDSIRIRQPQTLAAGSPLCLAGASDRFACSCRSRSIAPRSMAQLAFYALSLAALAGDQNRPALAHCRSGAHFRRPEFRRDGCLHQLCHRQKGSVGSLIGSRQKIVTMRILWVKADKLLPVQNGGNIRTYHVLRYLSARHELTFYSYYGGAPDPDYERELQRQLPGAVAVCTGKRELSGAARGLDYLAHLSAQPPYAVSRFAHAKVQKQLQSWFREQRFDVAVCDFLDAAVNFPGSLNIPSVLFQHNVESEIWRRHAATAGNPAKKMMYGMEFRKMLRYERAAVCKFQHVIAVSENDRRS